MTKLDANAAPDDVDEKKTWVTPEIAKLKASEAEFLAGVVSDGIDNS